MRRSTGTCPTQTRSTIRVQWHSRRRRLVGRGLTAFAAAAVLAPAAWADGTPLASSEPSTTPQPTPASADDTERAEPGATALSVATQPGLQVAELARANGLSPPPPPGGNGRLPFSQQAPIHSPRGPAYLAPSAARAWEAMRQASLRELGVNLYPFGPDSAYRSYGKQVEAWRLFKAGGPEAAPPGTSAHGLGKAVDLASLEMRNAIDKLGSRFGWAKTEVPSEWGHVNYVGG
jgi:LAS superfamily LD-carboxypeptidase LdcB